MLILILAYIGGIFTILSPCVLPVIPFIFSRSDQPFRKSGLPMLIGMGLSFAAFAALSVVGGKWVIQANQIGRSIALLVFALLGLTLIFPTLAERFSLPFVRFGGLLQKKADHSTGLGSSLLLGASIGLLWAPCAGPILGLILAGATLEDSGQKTFALLFVFAMGAATSLGLAILAGNRAIAWMKKGFGAEAWMKRILGIAVLCAALAIALGLDTRFFSKFSYINTSSLEQALVNATKGQTPEKASLLADEGPLPSLEGATQWLNSAPLSPSAIQGKVVLIDFWTYSCINCIRTLPYLKAWDQKYRSQGLIIIGVHAPEFAFEKSVENVKKAVSDFQVSYPVAVDSNLTIWTAFKNQYWPAHYFVDSKGRIRFHHFGEGNYEESEKVIQSLLAEAHGASLSSTDPLSLQIQGVEAPPSTNIASPETYVGYVRQEGFVSIPEIQKDQTTSYQLPSPLSLNQWGFTGLWKMGPESSLASAHGKLAFRFRARDLHLVIGSPEGKTIPFRVTLDGHAPGQDHGQDTDTNGVGEVKSHRLYQLIRQSGDSSKDHTFQIEFLAPGAEVFAFTFG